MKYSMIVMLCTLSSCTMIPKRNTLTVDKVIQLDDPTADDIKLTMKLEWIR